MSSTGAAERQTLLDLLGRIALPLAFLAAAAARATFLVDAADAADLRFLALVGTVALLGIAALDRVGAVRTAGLALLAQILCWALPAGDVRSASFFALLVVGLAFVTWERVRAGLDLDLHQPVAWALAVQALSRPWLYLAPRLEPSFLLEALLAPSLIALAGTRLARRDGDRIWLAILAIPAIAGGFGLEAALALAVLAGARALGVAGPRRSEAAAWLAAALALSIGLAGTPWALALVLSVACIAALLLATHDVSAAIATLALALGLVSAQVWWVAGELEREIATEPLRALVLGLVALPLAVSAPAGRRFRAAIGLILATVAGLALPVGAALAAPLVAVSSALPERGPKLGLQAGWLGLAASSAAIAASFPWLRPVPLEAALGWFGLALDLRTGAIVVGVFWLATVLTPTRPLVRRAALVTAAFVALASFLLTNPSQRLLVSEAAVLDSLGASTLTRPAGVEIRRLTLDSYVSNSTRLENGAPVGRIVIETEDGGERVLPLALGRETGEWAARRPGLDVAPETPTTPEAWISWLAPDGPYFAQRYRTDWTLDGAVAARRVRVELDDSLPEDVTLAVFRIGAR